MGKIKRVEISQEVIDFYRKQTAGMNREEALDFIEDAARGDIDFSHNKRIKRCKQCAYFFEDGKANKKKCCSAECKKRYDTSERKAKRQQATAERQGLQDAEELEEKRARDRITFVSYDDQDVIDYFQFRGNDGNKKKNTTEIDESGEGKRNEYVRNGQRKVNRKPSEVLTYKTTPEEVAKELEEKYGAHKLRGERMRAQAQAKRKY